MTTTAKASLRSLLSQTELIDPLGLSPFVALHLGESDRVHVWRTGAIGYMETDEAPSQGDPGWTFVAYGHLQDCLRVIESDEVEVTLLAHGGVQLRSVAGAFDTELRVHTVPRQRSGFKVHTPGDSFQVLDPSWLSGLNVKPFTLAVPPIVDGARVVLITTSGAVVWTSPFDPGIPSSPRESFLKAVSGMGEGMLELTERGFFHARLGGLHIYTAGHQTPLLAGAALLGSADDGQVPLPASRLVQALKAACALAAQGTSIQVNPRTGVTTRDSYANPARFSLGEVEPFPPMSLSVKTAKLLADALEQTSDESAMLTTVLGQPDIFRLTRGSCEVSFKTIPAC